MTQTRAALFCIFLLTCSSSDQPAPETTIAASAHHLTGEANEYDALLGAIGSAHLVLLGEATHGTHEMQALQRYLIERNGHDNIVVWAHNSHVGDARATGRAQYGEWNLGQLVREHWPRGASFTVGFFTHSGTVMAASGWGGKPRVQKLNTSMRGSHGAISHETGLPRFYVILNEIETRAVRTPRLQRAVGVIYLPGNEYEAHYYTATLREQFDAAIHIDETRAVTALP